MGVPVHSSKKRKSNFNKWLTQHGFRLINTPGEATYLGHTRNRSLSVLDLTFANGPATQNACPSDWAVNQDIAYGSDHYAIWWTLFNNIEPCNNICGQRFNIKDTDCKKWIEAFEEAYKANFQDIAIIMDKEADITADTLEAATTRLTQIFEQASIKAAKICKPSPKAKPWWNEGLSESAALIRFYRDTKHSQIEETGICDVYIEAEIRRTQNFFK